MIRSGRMTEWVVPSNYTKPGSVRIVTFGNKMYLTIDHYNTFIIIEH